MYTLMVLTVQLVLSSSTATTPLDLQKVTNVAKLGLFQSIAGQEVDLSMEKWRPIPFFIQWRCFLSFEALRSDQYFSRYGLLKLQVAQTGQLCLLSGGIAGMVNEG